MERLKPIKPAWNETFKYLAGILGDNKHKELVEAISKDYFDRKKRFPWRSKLYSRYNPSLDELCLARDCLQENSFVMTISTIKFSPIFEISDRKKYWRIHQIYLETEAWHSFFGGRNQSFSEYPNFDAYYKKRKFADISVEQNEDMASYLGRITTLADFYKRELASNGWVIEQTANIGGSTVLSAKKDTRMLGVYIADAGDGQVSVTVSIAIPN